MIRSRFVIFSLLSALLVAGVASAQTQQQNHPRSAFTGTEDLRDVRPFASWLTDSVISEGIDVEPFLDFFNGEGDDDGMFTGARFSVWTIETLEVGGQLGFIDIDGGDQGISDFLVYGRYEINMGEDMPDLTVGAHVDLPTGDEDVGESTVDFTTFAAARFSLVNGWDIHAHAGLQSLEIPTGPNDSDRESGLILGGGLIVPITGAMSALGEFNIGNNDFAAVTAGVDYELPPGNHLRAGLSIGLDTGAPDLQLRIAMAIPIY